MPFKISDITNPDVIKFLIESYEKTARLRMKWNNVHEKSLKHAATLGREEKGYYETDVLEASMICGMAASTRDNIASARNRRRKPIRDGVFIPGIAHLRKGHSLPEVGLGSVEEDPRFARPDTDLTIDPVMRPIAPEQRKIIYKDIPYFGREVYLKQREKIMPEKRYYMRETGGWEYGWRLKDSYFGKKQFNFGKVYRLTHGTKSRTGPQPDPSYYASDNIPGVSKCPV